MHTMISNIILTIPSLDFVHENPYPLILCSIFIYIILRFYILKKSFFSLYDPLHITIITLSFALSIIALPFYGQEINIYTYLVVMFFLGLFLVIASKFTVIKKGETTLKIPRYVQISLSTLILILISLHFIFNVLSGPILLLDSEYGSNARYLLYRNNRFLNWSYISISTIPIILFCLTNHSIVRFINFASLLFNIFISLFMASKSSFFVVFFMFYQYVFLMSLKGVEVSKKLRLIVNSFLLLSFFVYPVFIILIKLTDNPLDALNLVVVRLLVGFDQLIYWIKSPQVFPESQGISLIEIYFGPILKLLFGYVPEFNTAVELLYSKYFSYSDVSIGSLPNPNLIIELVFSCGLFLAIPIYLIFTAINFCLRKFLLELSELRYYHLPLFQAFVFYPCNILVDDQSFVVSLYSSIFLFFAFQCTLKITLFAFSLLYPLGIIKK
jgi:hypothetical protein